MPSSLSMQARWEVIQHLAPRYQQAPRAQKTCLLNECVSVTGYARKYTLQLLNHPEEARLQGQRACLYGEDALNALLAAWTAANHICAKLLMPFLPTLLESLERHGHLRLSQEHRNQLLTMSVAIPYALLSSFPRGGILSGGDHRQRRLKRSGENRISPVFALMYSNGDSSLLAKEQG